jgi:hypothetical protein
MSEYNQGTYRLIHPEKYIGKGQPFYRSSWEQKVCYYMDFNSNVIRWASEFITIPYFFSMDNKYHNYITDFYAEIRETDGVIRKYIFEIKPSDQHPDTVIKVPKNKTNKSMKNYAYKRIMQEKNKCKWESATEYCKKYGMKFVVLTEKDLFI